MHKDRKFPPKNYEADSTATGQLWFDKRLETAHSGKVSRPKIGVAKLLIAPELENDLFYRKLSFHLFLVKSYIPAVVISVIRFIPDPAINISIIFIEDAPNTIALGAVATGSMKAYEHVRAADMT